MNLFIDTNVFLSFYHLTSDDLEELNKLSVLLEQGQVSLFIPKQVITEFKRNRENRISAATKRLKDQKLNLQFPQLCKDYEEYTKLRELQKEYEKYHAELLKKISNDVDENTLKADKTIEELFKSATLIEFDNELVQKARFRMDVGNPPGKNGSLGDAINWEALLKEVQDNEDLYFISDDRDYCSALDENRFKEYLLTEWKEGKNSNLIFYKKLSSFFKDNFPDIKLASELEKELLIRNLAHSGNFAITHSVIAKLSKYSDFTTAQVNEMVEASLNNSQVTWIIADADVHEFFNGIVKNYADKIEEDNLNELNKALLEHEEDEEEEPDELPF